MQRLDTRLDGLVLVQPHFHGDVRGFFLESYRENVWAEHGIRGPFVQDNHSRSGRGVLRGMHFSIGAGQAKLVRCARGQILDVVVDLRRASPTYGEWESVELDDEGGHQLYIPVGFAHGFCVLSDVADVRNRARKNVAAPRPAATANVTMLPIAKLRERDLTRERSGSRRLACRRSEIRPPATVARRGCGSERAVQTRFEPDPRL